MNDLEATQELARLIEEASGNLVPAAHHSFLTTTAKRRAVATGQRDVARYVAALRRGALADEWTNLLPLVTVNESSFFRTPQHFAALTQEILPRLMERRSPSRRLRIWSAGCARGEEPGTLAIVLAERQDLAGWDWSILATDVDDEALAAARVGRYGWRAVSAVPSAQLQAYFASHGNRWELAAALRARIEYRRHNLVGPPAGTGQQFDVIFLRNVLIYFSGDAQRRVVASLSRVLAADGCLFLGPSETLWQLSQDFEPLDLGDCFCYCHRAPTRTGDRGSGTGDREIRMPSGVARAGSIAAKGVRATRGHVEESKPPAPRAARPPAPRPARSAAGGGEQLREALATRPTQPDTPAQEAWGTKERLEAACSALLHEDAGTGERLVQEALLADPTDPEAHALEGYIHDLGGRPEMAIASYRAALYLDHRLFQCRLLLADVLRNSGWRERAQREYNEVLALLSSGRAREAQALTVLPLASRDHAAARSRRALHHAP